MTAPHRKPILLDDSDIRVVDPTDVEVEPSPFDAEPSEDFLASVRRHGVLAPPPVEEVSPGRLILLSGRRRLAAAKALGLPTIKVQVLHGSVAENRLAACHESVQHRDERSTVERAWEISPYLKAAEEDGRDLSVRAVAKELGVSIGTAQRWMKAAEMLPQERVLRLAEHAHIEPRRVVALPVRVLKPLLKAPNDEAAVDILREIAAPAKKPMEHKKALEPESSGLWTGLRRMLVTAIGWIRKALAVLAAILRHGRSGSSA